MCKRFKYHNGIAFFVTKYVEIDQNGQQIAEIQMQQVNFTFETRIYSKVELYRIIEPQLRQIAGATINVDRVISALIDNEEITLLTQSAFYPAPVECPLRPLYPASKPIRITIPSYLFHTEGIQVRNALGQFTQIIEREQVADYTELLQWIIAGCPDAFGMLQLQRPGLDVCTAQYVFTDIFTHIREARRYIDYRRGTVLLPRITFNTSATQIGIHPLTIPVKVTPIKKVKVRTLVPTHVLLLRFATSKDAARNNYTRVREFSIFYTPETKVLINDKTALEAFMKFMLDAVLEKLGYRNTDYIIRSWAFPYSGERFAGKAILELAATSLNMEDGYYEYREYSLADMRNVRAQELAGTDYKVTRSSANRLVDSGRIDAARLLKIFFRSPEGARYLRG